MIVLSEKALKALKELLEHLHRLQQLRVNLDTTQTGMIGPKIDAVEAFLKVHATIKDPVTFPYSYNGWTVVAATGDDLGCRGSVRNMKGYVATNDADEEQVLMFKPTYGRAPTLKLVLAMIDAKNEPSRLPERKGTEHGWHRGADR